MKNNNDFRLMGEYQNGLLWYSISLTLSIWQGDDIFCGWKGNLENMPNMENMFIGKSMSEVIQISKK